LSFSLPWNTITWTKREATHQSYYVFGGFTDKAVKRPQRRDMKTTSWPPFAWKRSG
jgi:hypothetical protein